MTSKIIHVFPQQGIVQAIWSTTTRSYTNCEIDYLLHFGLHPKIIPEGVSQFGLVIWVMWPLLSFRDNLYIYFWNSFKIGIGMNRDVSENGGECATEFLRFFLFVIIQVRFLKICLDFEHFCPWIGDCRRSIFGPTGLPADNVTRNRHDCTPAGGARFIGSPMHWHARLAYSPLTYVRTIWSILHR